MLVGASGLRGRQGKTMQAWMAWMQSRGRTTVGSSFSGPGRVELAPALRPLGLKNWYWYYWYWYHRRPAVSSPLPLPAPLLPLSSRHNVIEWNHGATPGPRSSARGEEVCWGRASKVPVFRLWSGRGVARAAGQLDSWNRRLESRRPVLLPGTIAVHKMK